ncbi:MAG: zinc transporter ZupT, partial [Clostridiales bacterium]|nr:zinc transporter ZupT [Clostridiales bacterium]
MEQNVAAALFFSLMAGLSTSIGSLMVLLTNRQSTRFLSFSLGFSAGVMIFISTADLLPESVASIQPSLGELGAGLMAVTSLVIGILIAAAIDHVIPQPV